MESQSIALPLSYRQIVWLRREGLNLRLRIMSPSFCPAKLPRIEIAYSFNPSAVGSTFVLEGSLLFGYGLGSFRRFKSIPSHITAS